MELISHDRTASVPKEINLSIDNFSLINNKGDGTWDINIPLNADNIASKPTEYGKLAFSMEVDHQTAKVYPAMTEMSMDLVTELDSGIFYDENGVIYKQIGDGNMTDLGDVLPHFESSYFNEPTTLYLVSNKRNNH